MHDGKALHTPACPTSTGITRPLRKLLLKRLWLPHVLREALPYLYILGGLVALGSAFYSPDWSRILPWSILVSLICLPAGIALATLRYRFRQRRKNHTHGE